MQTMTEQKAKGPLADPLTDILYELAEASTEDHDEAKIEQERKRHKLRLSEACADLSTESPEKTSEL